MVNWPCRVAAMLSPSAGLEITPDQPSCAHAPLVHQPHSADSLTIAPRSRRSVSQDRAGLSFQLYRGASLLAAHQGTPRGVRIVKEPLSAPVSPEAVARSVYPIPGRSMLRSEKVATPLTAATGFVPRSVPASGTPALRPIAIVTKPV